MKIIALTNNNIINQQLANYTLSLFEQTKTEFVNYTELDSNEILAQTEDASLIVMVIDGNEVLNHEILSNKAILLMSIFQNGYEDSIVALMKSTIVKLKNTGNTIWGTYCLLDTVDAFNAELEIDNIGKRLELIRKINSLMYYDLGIRDNNHFSCGITPPKYYVGDSIGY